MTDDEKQFQRRGGGRVWAGIFLLLVGGILLLDQMGFPLPDWLFSWHALLVGIGLFIGLRHNFRGGAWLILIAIGGIYLVQDFSPDVNLHRFIWPGIFILIGLVFILRPRSRWQEGWDHNNWKGEWKRDRQKWKREWRDKWHRHHWHGYGPQVPPVPGDSYSSGGSASGTTDAATGPTPSTGTSATTGETSSTGATSSTGGAYSSTGTGYTSEDYIDTTSVFGGVHKKVVSKNFRGGDVTTFLGGTEIDLTQADFTGAVRLDVTQVMGGTKIIVPPHWEVRTEVTAIFAGFEDKRQQPPVTNPGKVLILEGTSIFGGIELRNY